jgi:hypothetical protein
MSRSRLHPMGILSQPFRLGRIGDLGTQGVALG